MARSVFYGVGAFIGSITSPTKVGFWPDDPNKLGWTATPLVNVDLANTPEACLQGKITPAQVEVDDYVGNGGLTRVGPMFPGGAVLGTLYLEDSRCNPLPHDPRKLPRAYEWATVFYYDGPMAGLRFHGFHGQVQKVNAGMALVSLWARGTSAVAAGPMGTYWLDWANHVHPADPALPAITAAPGQVGAIYISSKAGGGGVMPFDTPKTPKWIGGVPAPEGRRVR